MTNKELTTIFSRNMWVIQQQVDGLNHEDSIRQLPFRGNCLNWVLGHILNSRNGILERLGQESILSEEESALYAPGSEPITDGATAIPFDTLMASLEKAQEQILQGIETVSEETMSAWAYEEDKVTVRDSISFGAWHETYHVGQLEYLRQLAGKDDKVI